MAFTLNQTRLRMTQAKFFGRYIIGSGVGTVTTITASTGITLTPNPIVATGTVALTTPVVVANGGTGLAGGTSGGVPYYSGAATIASSALLAQNALVVGGGAGVAPATLGSLGTTTTVLHGNAVGNPTFGAVALATDVSGTLTVPNGGTGITTLAAGRVPYGAGAAAFGSTANFVWGSAEDSLSLGGSLSDSRRLGVVKDWGTTGANSNAIFAQNTRTTGDGAGTGTGVWSVVNASNVAGTLAGLASFFAFARATGAGGTVSTVRGFSSAADVSAGATITSLAHFGCTDTTGAGTLTEQYGLYISDLTKGGTNWAIYTAGTTPSVFMGKVSIGTASTTASQLLVDGTIEIAAGSGGVLKFQDGTTQASAAAGGGTVNGTGTATNIAFWTALTTISSDNGLYWDNVNKRLGVGTNAPAVLGEFSAAGDGVIAVKRTGAVASDFTVTAASGIAKVGSVTNNVPVATLVNNVEITRTTGTGLGILKTPAVPLDVNGNAAIKDTLTFNGSVGGTVALKAQANAGSTTFELPDADGAAGQYLKTDGAGILSFDTPAGAGTVTTNGAISAGMVMFNDPLGATVITGEGNLFYNNTLNRLGVLTSSPLSTLHVGAAGGAPAQASEILVDVNGPALITTKNTLSATEAAFGADASGGHLSTQTNSPLLIKTNNVLAATVNTSQQIVTTGSLGVGVTPARTLDVANSGFMRGRVQDYGGQVFNVLAYGADPTGVADSQAAIQAALNAAAALTYGGEVFMPTGTYRVDTQLNVGINVTLSGVGGGETIGNHRTILNVTADAGNPGGTAFITMAETSSIRNLTFNYPNQVAIGIPTSYPFTIRGAAFTTIDNIHLYNSYQGIDMASYAAGNLNSGFRIHRVSGQPLLVGIDVDKSYDWSWITDVHFWPYFSLNLMPWTVGNGIAIRFGRADSIKVRSVSAYGYNIGIQFNYSALGSTGGTYGEFFDVNFENTNIGLDVWCTNFPGVHFDGFRFAPLSGTELRGIWGHPSVPAVSDTAYVTVSGSTFWANMTNAVYWDNNGPLTFTDNKIMEWYNAGYAVEVLHGRAIVQGNYFADNWLGNPNAAFLSPNGLHVGAAAQQVNYVGNQILGHTVLIENGILTVNQNNQ